MGWVFNSNTNNFDYQPDRTASGGPVQYPMTPDTSGTTSQTTRDTTTPNVPSWITPYAQQLAGQAGSLAGAPTTPYTGQFTAPITAEENRGIALAGQMPGVAQQGLNQAADIYGSIGQYGLEGPTSGQLDAYTNPYQTRVMDASRRRQQEEYTRNRNQLLGQMAQTASFGGSGSAIAASELSRNFQNQLADQEAQQLHQGFQTAQEGVRAGMGIASGAAAGIGNTAMQGQAAGLADIGAQYAAGGLKRGISQADLDARYQDFIRQQEAKKSNLGTASNILSNLSPFIGETRTGQLNKTVVDSSPSAPPPGPNPEDEINRDIAKSNLFDDVGTPGTIAPPAQGPALPPSPGNPQGTPGTIAPPAGVPQVNNKGEQLPTNIIRNSDGSYTDSRTGQKYDKDGNPIASEEPPTEEQSLYQKWLGYLAAIRAWYYQMNGPAPTPQQAGLPEGYTGDPNALTNQDAVPLLLQSGAPSDPNAPLTMAQGGLVPGYNSFANGGIVPMTHFDQEYLSPSGAPYSHSSSALSMAKGGLVAMANSYHKKLVDGYNNGGIVGYAQGGIASGLAMMGPNGRMAPAMFPPQGMPQRPMPMGLPQRMPLDWTSINMPARGFPPQGMPQRPMPMRPGMPMGPMQRAMPPVMSVQDRYRQMAPRFALPLKQGNPPQGVRPMGRFADGGLVKGYQEGDIVDYSSLTPYAPVNTAIEYAIKLPEYLDLIKNNPGKAAMLAGAVGLTLASKPAEIVAALASKAAKPIAGIAKWATTPGIVKNPNVLANPAVKELIGATPLERLAASKTAKLAGAGILAEQALSPDAAQPIDTAKEAVEALNVFGQLLQGIKPKESTPAKQEESDIAALIKEVKAGNMAAPWNEELAQKAWDAGHKGGDSFKAFHNANEAYVVNVMAQLGQDTPTDKKLNRILKAAQIGESLAKAEATLPAVQAEKIKAQTAAIEASPELKARAATAKTRSDLMQSLIGATGDVPTAEALDKAVSLATVPTISSKAAYDILPSGSQYRVGNNLYTKQ